MTNFCKNWIFYLSTFSANLIFIAYGTTVSWNSPVLAELQSNDTSINPLGEPITIFQLSICSSLFSIGALIGTILVSKLPDILGRRKTLICLASVGMVSFSMMYFVTRFWMYVTLYTIVAISTAAGTTVVPTYLSEISEVKNRGIFSTAVALGKNLGQFYGYLLGPLTKFSTFSICCGLPLLLHLLLSFFTLESPVFLYLKGDKEEAIETLKKLRRDRTSVEIETEIREKEVMLRTKLVNSSFKILFKTRAGTKAFCLSIVVRLLPVTSGLFIIAAFLGPLLDETGSNISGYNLTVIVSLVKIITSIISISLVEKVGRKILVLIGSFGCGIGMCGLGIFFYFKENHLNFPSHFHILPIVCIIEFVISYNIGLGGVPYIVISEMLPNEVRAIGTGIIFFLCNIILVGISFSYPLVVFYLGTHYAMFSFSFFCFTGFILVLLFLPETKGKTFSQIQIMLEGNLYRH